MLSIKDGAGINFDLTSNQTQVIPSMISGTFQLKKRARHKFGYTILTKNQTGIKTSARNDTEIDVIPEFNNSGKEEYISQFSLKATLNEQWFGGCYSYKMNKHFSFGFSLFAAYRVQTLEESYLAKVIPPTISNYSLYITPIISYNDVQSVEMTTVRGIGKIGIAFTYERLDFGLTITTPSLPVYGSTTIQRDVFFNYINNNNYNFEEFTANATTPDEYILAADSFRNVLVKNTLTINDRQSSLGNKIKATYKSPLSIAAGIVLKSKAKDENLLARRKIYLSFEYFHSVNPYFLIEPEKRNVVRPLSDKYNFTSVDFIGIKEASISVFNFALGFEQRLLKRVYILASFRTNNSYLDTKESYSNMTLSHTFWDQMHYSIGAIYKRKRSDISLGISYGAGFGSTNPYVVMTNPTEKNFLQGEAYRTHANFRAISLSIGYNYYFRCD